MVRSDNQSSLLPAINLWSAILPHSLAIFTLLGFLAIAEASGELVVAQGTVRDVHRTTLHIGSRSIDDAKAHMYVSDPANRERARCTLSLAGRPKTVPTSFNSQTRSATQWSNDPQNNGELRWISGIISEREARLNPMKTAPRRLLSGPASTYNFLIPRTTALLKATGFNFDIPTAAVITGIEVNIGKRQSRLGSVRDTQVRLIKNGAITGRNQAASGQWPNDSHISTYGSPDDRWNLALTPQGVNGYEFGVAIAVLLKPFDNFQTAEINSVAITVYWR